MVRRERVAAEIERLIAADDAAGILALVPAYRCACLGPREDEPKCPCEMTFDQVRASVSWAALQRGRIVKLKPKGY
jgi:hypothetical protein